MAIDPRGEFDRINRLYGLSLRRGATVIQRGSGRTGIIASVARCAWPAVKIRWDGCPHVARPEGHPLAAHDPFHPTAGLDYPDSPGLPLRGT